MIRHTTLLFVLLAALGLAYTSCSTTTKSSSAMLCGDCGWVKGSDKCCADGTEKCDCGLVKGSPGCCKIPAGADAVLCECGEVMNSEKCCSPDAEKCGCGKAKGSPGCCIDKKQGTR